MHTITLHSQQKKRGNDILKRVENDDTIHPLDLVDEWAPCPTWNDLDEMSPVDVFDPEAVGENVDQWVPMDTVVGTNPNLTSRFVDRRAERILKWMLAGDFQVKHEDRPHYIKVGDNYYVGADGNHRTLISKAVGVERLYAEVTKIPL
jgi:hypothetical protein